ncbi:MAG: hypothetical protein HKP53_09310 [Eudoraea sp.]|nr:hypothetical protein [Eudoraea sp.]
MSYKVKSLVYLICFIVSVVIYAQMETAIDQPQNEEMKLVQTNSVEIQQINKENL